MLKISVTVAISSLWNCLFRGEEVMGPWIRYRWWSFSLCKVGNLEQFCFIYQEQEEFGNDVEE